MNREIKVRAWDNETMYVSEKIPDEVEHYYNDFSIVVSLSGYCYRIENNGDGNDKIYSLPESATPMQFTGLKDIDNIDCYENDIIKAVWGEDINDEIFGIGKVIFNCGCFMIEWIDDKEANMELLGMIYKTGRPRVFKILGNGFENPELLTA